VTHSRPHAGLSVLEFYGVREGSSIANSRACRTVDSLRIWKREDGSNWALHGEACLRPTTRKYVTGFPEQSKESRARKSRWRKRHRFIFLPWWS